MSTNPTTPNGGIKGFAPITSNPTAIASTAKVSTEGELTHESVGNQTQQPAPYLEDKDFQEPIDKSTPPNGKTVVTNTKNIPLGKRKILKEKKPEPKNYTKLIWLIGHLLTFFFGILFIFYYFFMFRQRRDLISKIAYRSSFSGVIVAYLMTIISKFGKTTPDFFALITTENFQYLLLAIVWVFTRSSVFKILPYIIVSFLQLLKNYNLISKFPKSFIKGLAMVISYNELGLIIVLATNTLLFRGTSGFALVTFMLFYWLRIVYSESTKLFFKDVTEVINERVISKCPPNVQESYKKFLKTAEVRSEEVEKIFANIRNTHEETQAIADGKIDVSKEKDKPEDSAFATSTGDGPKDVNISASEKEPEK